MTLQVEYSTRRARELVQVVVPVEDNGREALWVEGDDGHGEVASVPVFAYGISKGASVAFASDGPRHRLTRVLAPSRGATVRCYTAKGIEASSFYRGEVAPSLGQRAPGFGSATIFDPDILALHVVSRSRLPDVAQWLDARVVQGLLRFWELGDPEAWPAVQAGETTDTEPWELAHPLPVDGEPSVVGLQ